MLEAETDILYLNAAGMPIIILDKYEDCAALLDRRSSVYSGRHVFVFGHKFACSYYDWG